MRSKAEMALVCRPADGEAILSRFGSAKLVEVELLRVSRAARSDDTGQTGQTRAATSWSSAVPRRAGGPARGESEIELQETIMYGSQYCKITVVTHVILL